MGRQAEANFEEVLFHTVGVYRCTFIYRLLVDMNLYVLMMSDMRIENGHLAAADTGKKKPVHPSTSSGPRGA